MADEDKKPLPTVLADDAGVLRPKNLEEAFRLAHAFCHSKILPARYSTPEMVFTAMQFASELGLQPLTALRQIAVVDGTPSIFGDLPLSLCYSKNLIESIREYLFDKNGNEISASNKNLSAEVFGAITIVKRRNDPEVCERFFTMEDARKANLYPGKENSTWRKYTKIMLKYRARAAALKDKFPDALNGVAIAEYDFDTIPDQDTGNISVAGNIANVGSGTEEIYTGTSDQNTTLRSLFDKYAVKKDSHAPVIKELMGRTMAEAESVVKRFGDGTVQ